MFPELNFDACQSDMATSELAAKCSKTEAVLFTVPPFLCLTAKKRFLKNSCDFDEYEMQTEHGKQELCGPS